MTKITLTVTLEIADKWKGSLTNENIINKVNESVQKLLPFAYEDEFKVESKIEEK